jgi:HD superfamily phosphohydrolase
VKPETDNLRRYRSDIEDLAREWLDPYVAALPSRGRIGQKEFNDPVWRTIVLRPMEVAVLDSPLLQRLRWVRQLGVAEFVFPGASHTRFQHSIGALHMVDQLIEAVQLSAGANVIDDAMHNAMRLTALCHDVGHGVMSHVSDNAMLLVDEAEDVRLDFEDVVGVEKPALSEIAAYYLIGSPAFQDLIDAAETATNDHTLPRNVWEVMQRCVVGLPISSEIPQLHELISGPFDADKLDYMTRDAQMAGVPVVTDIPRLVRKVRALRVARDDLPVELGRHVKGDAPSYVMLGIGHSGGRTLDELMLGRVLLFDKIYRHQKVRAIEAMVSLILLKVARLSRRHAAVTPLLMTDEEILDLEERDVARLAGRELEPDELADLATALRFGRLIKNRDLLDRCFAFSTRMPLDPLAELDPQRGGLLELQNDVTDRDKRAALAASIAGETEKILNVLGRHSLADPYRPELKTWIWLDPPESSRQSNVVSRAYLITGDGHFIKFQDDSGESKSWADAYVQVRALGYVFGPAVLRTYIYLASERVVRDTYGVRVPASMVDYSKQDSAEMDRVRRDLAAAGYYDDAAPDLKPVPDRLLMADVRVILARQTDRFAGYEGPSVKGDKGVHIVPARVEAWLRQFDDDELVDGALRLVQGIQVIGRSEVVASLGTFVASNPEFKGASLCAFGLPKDSSYVASYFAADKATELGLTLRDLSEALSLDVPIVFVDDFIGSGRQARNVLRSWLGEPLEDDLGERRQTLGEVEREALRRHELGFAFAAGKRDGADLLRTTCAELGISAKVSIRIDDAILPRAFGTGLFASEGQESRFRDAAVRIGGELLASTGMALEKIEGRRLGYGNDAFLVVFLYNTPTQSLTCLWSGGTAGGFPWLPLLPRRKKE